MNDNADLSPRRRRGFGRRKIVVAGAFGVLVGVLGVLFLTHIYNPLGTTLESPLVLMPEDVDFLIDIPDFPRVAAELPDEPFVARLKSHPGFQRFLAAPFVQRTGVVSTLEDAFAQIDEIDQSLPLGLRLLGDVSGSRVLLGGFEEGVEPGKPDIVLIVQPQSWMTIAGVNVLMSETLFSWFLEGPLSEQGIKVRHDRDLVTIDAQGGRPIHLIRVGDVLVAATDQNHLARMYKVVATQGIPIAAAGRFHQLVRLPRGDGQRVRLLTRTSTLDRTVGLRETLDDLWGPENLELARGLVPPIGDGDVLIEFRIGYGLEIEFEVDGGAPSPTALSRHYREFSEIDLRLGVEQLGRQLTGEVFGLMRVQVPAGTLFHSLIEDLKLIDQKTRELLDESLASVPSLGSLSALAGELDHSAEGGTYVGFFRQPREALEDEAEPGLVVLIPLKDKRRVEALLKDLRRELRAAARSNEGSAVRDVLVKEDGGDLTMGFDLAGGVVADPRVTKPGLALLGDWLVLTNFHPYLHRLLRRDGGEFGMLEDHPGLLTAAAGAPEELGAAVQIDGDTLFAYLDQSVQGWVSSRTSAKQLDFMQWRREGEAQAKARGLRPGSPNFEEAVEAYLRREQQAMTGKGPELLRRFRQRVDEFRGLVLSVGIFVTKGSLTTTYRLRVDLTAADEG